MAKPKRMIRVKPVSGRRVTLLDHPTTVLTGERSVPDVAFYRRAIARGDLELVPEGTEKAPKKGTKKEG